MKSTAVVAALGVLSFTNGQRFFGDGGYQSEPVECMTQWTFKEKLPDGSNLETVLSGCVSLQDFKPYPFYDEADASEIANLLEPSESNTNKNKWCAVLRDVYNPTPLKNEENKFNWGFCLDYSTESPTPEPTKKPTPKPTTGGVTPTPKPTTQTTQRPTTFPTEDERTEAPTLVEGTPPTFETDPSETEKAGVVLGEWTLIGIGIAGALVIIAAVLAVLLVVKLKAKPDDLIDENLGGNKDLEENSN